MIIFSERDCENTFIMQKDVDWSMLNEGFTIPVSLYPLLATLDKTIMTHGEERDVKILVNGCFYDVKLRNQKFKQADYANHKDVIQIRYSSKSPLAVKLREIFKGSYNYLFEQRLIQGKSKRKILLPEDFKEFMRLYLTTSRDILCMECSTCEESKQLANILSSIPEEIYETGDEEKLFMIDKSASLIEKEMLVKYRKIDLDIIKILKKFYDYRDEISGEKIGAEYGDSVVEAHHIDYFTTSQNNDSTNIVIISPNYHRIIHKNNPRFNRKKLQFEFPNGEILKLKLCEHLKPWKQQELQ